jgi:hypothetical protein
VLKLISLCILGSGTSFGSIRAPVMRALDDVVLSEASVPILLNGERVPKLQLQRFWVKLWRMACSSNFLHVSQSKMAM